MPKRCENAFILICNISLEVSKWVGPVGIVATDCLAGGRAGRQPDRHANWLAGRQARPLVVAGRCANWMVGRQTETDR